MLIIVALTLFFASYFILQHKKTQDYLFDMFFFPMFAVEILIVDVRYGIKEAFLPPLHANADIYVSTPSRRGKTQRRMGG